MKGTRNGHLRSKKNKAFIGRSTSGIHINKLLSAEGLFYHVSFVDKKNKAHIILMSYDHDVSEIQQREKHPAWVLALEPQLHRLISQLSAHQYHLARAV